MYTFDGSWRQVIVYLEGYIRGNGFPKGQVNLESGMEPFGRWLASKFGLPEHQPWQEQQPWHQTLIDHCGGDEERALHQLWPLYQEYMRDE
jgi:hypothetical protein